MKCIETNLVCLDETFPVKILSALEHMPAEFLTPTISSLRVVAMVDDRQYEPALYHHPCFVLPGGADETPYVKFLLAIRHAERFALLTLGDGDEPVALLHPYKNYLMMVLVRSRDELVEPEEPDFTAIEQQIAYSEVISLTSKMERLHHKRL